MIIKPLVLTHYGEFVLHCLFIYGAGECRSMSCDNVRHCFQFAQRSSNRMACHCSQPSWRIHRYHYIISPYGIGNNFDSIGGSDVVSFDSCLVRSCWLLNKESSVGCLRLTLDVKGMAICLVPGICLIWLLRAEETNRSFLKAEKLFGLLVECSRNVLSGHGSWDGMVHSTLFYSSSLCCSACPSQVQTCEYNRALYGLVKQ